MLKRLFKFLFKTLLWFLLLTILWVIAYTFIPVPYTPLMAIRSFQAESEQFETKHDWVPLSEISVNLQKAVIAAEDQQFILHDGFDYKAIEKAYEANRSGKRLRGGSTISQQTAKNVFLWPERSWLRKGLEAYFTVLIEFFWSKERILEVYLNSIEMGDGVYGAAAAANHWFGKSAANLTTYEAAAIAAILPNPRNYRAAPASTYIQQRKNWIVKQMNNYGVLRFTKEDEKE
ncbi:monofunctional biosynthetic peptidoglycan transglycosylase [Flavobacteriaceae bacterium TK19130]|nr:monofunctional biosynthetic peptidoglycan transglycosylase [Thermobacterium salinum]